MYRSNSLQTRLQCCKLIFFFQYPSEWRNILQLNKKDHVRIILVQSKLLRVIEAKLAIYKEYASEIDSENLLLQHVFEDCDEISKLSAHKKLSWISGVVECLSKLIPLKHLSTILDKAADCVLTEKNISLMCNAFRTDDDGTCVGPVHDHPNTYFLSFNVKKFKELLIRNVVKRIGNSLGFEIYDGILQYVDAGIRNELEIVLQFKLEICNNVSSIVEVTVESMISQKSGVFQDLGEFLGTLVMPVDVNSVQWRSQTAREIYTKIWDCKHSILDTILNQMKATAADLETVSIQLRKAKSKIQLTDQTKCK